MTDLTVERKQTLVNEKAWHYRFYIWMYPDFWTQKITFCRYFWGFTLLMPFAVFIRSLEASMVALGKGIWWCFVHFADYSNWVWDRFFAHAYMAWRERRQPIVEARRRRAAEKQKTAREKAHEALLQQQKLDAELADRQKREWEAGAAARKAEAEKRKRLEEEERKKREVAVAAEMARQRARQEARRQRWDRLFRVAEGAGGFAVSVVQKAWPIAKLPFYAFGAALVVGAVLVLLFSLVIIARGLWIVLVATGSVLGSVFDGVSWLTVTCASWLGENMGYIGGVILVIALLILLVFFSARIVIRLRHSERAHTMGNAFLDGLFMMLRGIARPLRACGIPVAWGAHRTAHGAARAGSKVGTMTVKAADTGVSFFSAMFLGVKAIKYKTCPVITVVDDEGTPINEQERTPKYTNPF